MSNLDLFAAVSFPAIDPVAFAVGRFEVHWYGLAYVAGILLAWLVARDLLKRERLWQGATPPLTLQQVDDFILWAAIGIVLGGRLGYVLFYDLPNVVAEPLRVFAVWDGGMSFHGGLIGTTVAMLAFARRNQIGILNLFDLVACVAPLGLFFGRLANFVNGELWGRPADVPWAMAFPSGGPFPRHPSQLYEAALEGLLLFIILQTLARLGHLRYAGRITGLFTAGYALARIFVEFFREPDPQLGYLLGGWLTMGMVLSLPMLLIGLALFARSLRMNPTPEQGN